MQCSLPRQLSVCPCESAQFPVKELFRVFTLCPCASGLARWALWFKGLMQIIQSQLASMILVRARQQWLRPRAPSRLSTCHLYTFLSPSPPLRASQSTAQLVTVSRFDSELTLSSEVCSADSSSTGCIITPSHCRPFHFFALCRREKAEKGENSET